MKFYVSQKCQCLLNPYHSIRNPLDSQDWIMAAKRIDKEISLIKEFRTLANYEETLVIIIQSWKFRLKAGFWKPLGFWNERIIGLLGMNFFCHTQTKIETVCICLIKLSVNYILLLLVKPATPIFEKLYDRGPVIFFQSDMFLPPCY